MQAFYSMVCGVVIFIIWTHNPLMSVRACGLFSLLLAGYWLYSGRIPFLFNQRHVGDITGPAAVLLCIAGICLGAFLLVYPEPILPHFSATVEYRPWRK
ncbi:MAG TPA: hypothetical protein VFA75_09335 [Nevskia sp.]|nr:hypothetical protein [Nevskia sp.]